MSSPPVSINGLTFVQNLNNLAWTSPPGQVGIPSFSQGLSALAAADFAAHGNNNSINNFFQSINKSTNPLPTNFDDFINKITQFIGVSSSTDPATGNSWISEFTQDFNDATHNAAASISVNPGNVDYPFRFLPSISFTQQFRNFFANFLTNFPYNSDGSIVSASDPPINSSTGAVENNFTTQLSLQLATTVSLQDPQSPVVAPLHLLVHVAHTVPGDLTSPPGFALVTPAATYQSIYNTLFPAGGSAGFLARLTTFYNSELADHGYFIPSQSFATWTNQLQAEYVNTLNQSGNIITSQTSLASAGFTKTLILDRIFLLVSSLLDTLQRVAAVQAQRLTILTNWQQAYTNAISQLPTFLQTQTPPNRLSNNSPGGGDSGVKDTIRSTLNTSSNANLRDFMQTNRSLIADASKSVQSNINQSSDAVTQQANMATAIIQELTTLLGAIYR